MDGIFNKLGIYDLMGIWGPGTIFVTFFTFTLHQPIHEFFSYCGITNPGIPDSYLLIILYTAVAYTIGVTLHEAGRCIANFLGLFHANDVHGQVPILQKPIALTMLKRVRWDYQEKINRTIPAEIYVDMSFDKAIAYLKYCSNKQTSRVDTYHSIYALARSLSITFSFHAIISGISLFRGYTISSWLFVFDLLMATLFFIRAYRHYYFWVESVFIQYYYIKFYEEDKT